MTYRKEIYETARQELSARRRRAEEAAAAGLAGFFDRCPRGRELRAAIQSTGSRAGIAVIKGGDVRRELTLLKEQNLALQQQFDALLKDYGLSRRDIEPQYSCPDCRDSGYVDGFMCECLKSLLKALCYQELNRSTPLEVSGFETFRTDYFKDYPAEQRSIMEKIFEYCKRYAKDFSRQSPSLLFQGGTGLGKTHLSLAIAKTAIEKGYGVIYGSVHNFAVALERERFDNQEEADTNALLSSCDLLVLDDLGTEFISSYTISAIYNVINTRIMKKLPTIISTNLSSDELQKRYSERLISRLFGSYNRLGFAGRDIRSVKKIRGEA